MKIFVRFPFSYYGPPEYAHCVRRFWLDGICWKTGEVTREAKFLFAGTKEDADCSILLSGDTCVVIDTGEEEDAPPFWSFLKIIKWKK